jgi:hypothetical protein
MLFGASPLFYLPTLGKACSILLFSDFVEEKNVKDYKKNMAFFVSLR